MNAKISADKKARVLSSAEAVFLQQGYARTTMADLASAAGMSRPALYLLYPRKHEVFSSIINDEMDCTSRPHDTQSEAGHIQHWIVWVCDLWLGRQRNQSAEISDERRKLLQRADAALKELKLLETTLDQGLALRFDQTLGDDLRNLLVRVLTACVCGLVDSKLDAPERRRLLAFQAEVLVQAALRPETLQAKCAIKTTI